MRSLWKPFLGSTKKLKRPNRNKSAVASLDSLRQINVAIAEGKLSSSCRSCGQRRSFIPAKFGRPGVTLGPKSNEHKVEAPESVEEK